MSVANSVKREKFQRKYVHTLKAIPTICWERPYISWQSWLAREKPSLDSVIGENTLEELSIPYYSDLNCYPFDLALLVSGLWYSSLLSYIAVLALFCSSLKGKVCYQMLQLHQIWTWSRKKVPSSTTKSAACRFRTISLYSSSSTSS